MCINSGAAALAIQRYTTDARVAQCKIIVSTTHISQAPTAKMVSMCISTHLLGGMAGGCAGEGAHSHNVLRLRVQTLLGPQVEAAQERLYRALGYRGHPGHPLPYLLWGPCSKLCIRVWVLHRHQQPATDRQNRQIRLFHITIVIYYRILPCCAG